MSPDLPFPADFNFVQQCLDHEESAVAALCAKYRDSVRAFLQGTGATYAEAAETVDSLWADCFAPGANGRPRLTRYDGSSTLQTWLNAVAFNALLTQKRIRARRSARFVSADAVHGGTGNSLGTTTAAEENEHSEEPIVTLMRQAIEFAFVNCPAEDFVLLQLEHCDQLEREELARMFGCSKPTISRQLERARQGIAESTLRFVRERDSWLDLRWPDFVELCRAATPACFGLDD